MAAGEVILPKSGEAMYNNFHFAPAIRHGDRLFASGQIGIGPDGKAPADPEAQFDLAFKAVEAVLAEAGSSFDNVIEMTTYHVGLQEHMGTFMKVKDTYVKEPYPAWTAIGITELAIPGGLVEIRVIAAN